MSNKKQRESNIELLRITSMLIIIVYHFFSHSIIHNAPELSYIIKPLITILHIGVICFVLISGYWGIKFSLKGFTTLFLYCSFYSILIYCVGCLLNPELFNLKNSIKSLIPNQWWFIPVYLSLFLLIPLINIPLKNSSNGKKIFLIIILGTISFGFGQFIPSLSTGKNPINFVLIYYLGNYIRTGLVLPSKLNIRKIIFIYLMLNFLIFLIILLSEIYSPIVSKVVFQLFFPYNSIGLIINSMLFFLIFTQLSFSSKLINWFASSTLSVYLIHENKYIGQYVYNYVGTLQHSIENLWLFSFVVLLLALFVFMASVFIDKLIAPIFQFIINYILDSKLFISIDKKVYQLLD